MTPEKLGMVVLLLTLTQVCYVFSWLHAFREEYFLPCCGAVLVSQQKGTRGLTAHR